MSHQRLCCSADNDEWQYKPLIILQSARISFLVWQLLALGSKQALLFFPSFRPCKFNTADKREQEEFSSIKSLQDIMVSSPSLPYQAGVICYRPSLQTVNTLSTLFQRQTAPEKYFQVSTKWCWLPQVDLGQSLPISGSRHLPGQKEEQGFLDVQLATCSPGKLCIYQISLHYTSNLFDKDVFPQQNIQENHFPQY